MRYLSPWLYGLKAGILLLALLGNIKLAAQPKIASPTQPPAPKIIGALPTPGLSQPAGQHRPAVAEFRQQLINQETARRLGVTIFLACNTQAARAFTDAKGVYHFLHHIDEQGQPVYYQTRSNLGLATSINTNKLWQGGSLGLSLQGQGMELSPARSRLGMWEPGPARISHREFTGRALTRDTPPFSAPGSNADHATHVAGTMIAQGINPLARGMANQARLDCYETQTDEYLEMQTAAADGMLISNHSYGPHLDRTRLKLGVYDESCQIYDNITFQNKNYLQFHAAGNDRNDDRDTTYDILIGSANAKNVVTIGAVQRLEGGYKGPASVRIADFSSYGPTDDGRVKPDFVAPGVDILSAYSSSDDAYSSSQGTSMASPGAAGSLFLLQQHYRNINNRFMRAASLKGLAIHTADEAGSHPGPDYAFGWGLLNLEKAIDLMNQTSGLQVLEEATLADGSTYQKRIRTAGGPFKTTICWTDVPGTPLVNGGRDNRTPMLVNDLDLRVIDLATNQPLAQLPWKLDPATPTAGATRGDNIVDNVEQIFVESLPAGQYMIQVSHKRSLQQGSQEFSLLVSSVATGGALVKVNSTDPSASEGSSPISGKSISPQLATGRARVASTVEDPGFIRFERNNTAGELVVHYQIGGTATNGTDFATLPTSVTFAQGQSELIEEIDPIEDDLLEGDESIIITLVDSDDYDPDPDNLTTTVTIKDHVTTSFAITGVTTVSCIPVVGDPNRRSLSFLPQYSGNSGQPISFSVVNEMLPTTTPGPYSLSMYIDNPTITLKATQSGTTGEASFLYNWLAACGTNPPPPTAPFAITGVTTVSCVPVVGDPNRRSLSFLPQYSGNSGQPISFSVVNEMLPTTTPGPYSLGMYIDNPTITLKATQMGTPGEASFVYNWLAACGTKAKMAKEIGAEGPMAVRVLGNPITGGRVYIEITGAAGQPLQLHIVNTRGTVVSAHRIEQPGSIERYTFDVGRQPVGTLLLRVATPTQASTITLLKAD